MGLVLTRHEGESVVMRAVDGTRVVCKVARVKGDEVRLHFDAPSSVDIHRSEVDEAIMRDGRKVVSGAHPARATPPM